MLTPFSRDEMQALKAGKDEEKRIENVKKCVALIYKEAIYFAETSIETSYIFEIDPHKTLLRVSPNVYNDTYYVEYQFYRDNMEDILNGLQTLFPGCTVKLINMCTGTDGKRYDISKINENMLPLVDLQTAFECIVVDWS